MENSRVVKGKRMDEFWAINGAMTHFAGYMSKFAGYISTSIVSSILKKQQPSWLHTYIYTYSLLLRDLPPPFSLFNCPFAAVALYPLWFPFQLKIIDYIYIYMPQHYNYALNSRTKTDWGWFHDSRWASKFAIICSHQKCPLLAHVWIPQEAPSDTDFKSKLEVFSANKISCKYDTKKLGFAEDQWKFQDPKMELLFRTICLAIYFVATSNWEVIFLDLFSHRESGPTFAP